jgi:hypothetical protein
MIMQNYYIQKYEDYVVDIKDIFIIEDMLVGIQYKQQLRLIDNNIHPLIGFINLN